MSNSKNEKNEIEEDQDYWEIFQSETDENRNLILDYLVKKCDSHDLNEFPESLALDKLDENKTYHFFNCKKYLFESERRRKPFKNGKLVYFHHPCQELKENYNCIKGDMCQFSHTEHEIKFHPMTYRKEMCFSSNCENKKIYCYNAHRVQDRRYFPFKRKKSSNSNINIKNENYLVDFNDKLSNNKVIEVDQKQTISNKSKNTTEEEMVNKLNFDIKNLLDELDLNQLEEDEEVKKEGIDDDFHQIESNFIFMLNIYINKPLRRR